MDSILTRLQNWYKINCNGEWEHNCKFSIETLDNPGWSIILDLHETSLENLEYKRDYQNKENVFDWYIIRMKNKSFNIGCGPDNLEKTLKIFLDEVVPDFCDPSFRYNIYIPLFVNSSDIWSPAKGKRSF